jgi:L-seryl-tRNA(Ser) seleniumtransferase
LTRAADDIEALARRIAPTFAAALRGRAQVEVKPCHSQIGSGALPIDLLPSWALALSVPGRGDRALEQLARALRALPVPIVGRIAEHTLLLDLRTLDDEHGLLAQLLQINGCAAS